MVKTLRESKAKLSQLVELASQGEDVLISVRGKIKARLTRAAEQSTRRSSSDWVRDLKALYKAYGKTQAKLSSEQIISEIRQDRV
jgi:prevent-host-death family protein